MKTLTRIIAIPLGILVIIAVELYLAWERRKCRWHRPMTTHSKRTVFGR
jgi:hypothetical protein